MHSKYNLQFRFSFYMRTFILEFTFIRKYCNMYKKLLNKQNKHKTHKKKIANFFHFEQAYIVL